MSRGGKIGVAIALIAAVIAAIVAPAYLREIAAARSRASQASIAQTACGPIQYAERGEGPPLLVVHGAGGGFDQGLDIAGPLSKAGFRVIAVSRFGYLGTPLPADASARAQARAHACLLDALGIPAASVLGASAGAPSSLEFAILFPERTKRLVLLVPAAYTPRPGNAPSVEPPAGVQLLFDTALRSDFLFWALIRAAPRLAIGTILATPPALVDGASPEEKALVEVILAHVLPVAPRRLGLVNDAAVVSSLKPFAYERVTAPTLAISAEDDGYRTLEPARYTAAQVRGARLVVYPTGGHLLVGHSREAQAEIARFLGPQD